MEAFDAYGLKVGSGKVFKENGKKIKVVWNGENGKENITEWEHNEDGNIISEKRTDNERAITFFQKYEYIEFDEKNNWTKRLIYEDDNDMTPKDISIRKIKYY